MRKSVSRLSEGALRWQLMMAGTAAILLSGCSGSVERFSENYSNPSDSDPVYTASIPKSKSNVEAPAYKAPAYKQPQVSDHSNDGIVQSPIADKPIVKQQAYDYTKAYSGTYSQQAQNNAPQQPAYAQPKLAYNNAPAATEYQKPAYKQPAVIADSTTDNTITDDAPAAPAKKPVAVPFKTAQQSAAEAQAVKTGKPVPATKAAVVQDETADAAPAAGGKTYTVEKGDTLFSLGRKYNMSPFAIADANKLPHDKPLTVGKQLTIPGKDTATAAATKTDGKIKPLVQQEQEDVAKSDGPAAKQGKEPAVQPDETAQADEPAAKPVATAAASDGALSMRWPVRGKVISGFGPKTGGMKNEGINISVPEGTNVQAAEGGVVAYAGNELKGYGNLVLIRHAGGYVTAYAHNSQIIVKKGDTVKRGDLIAKSGSTGSVSAPQLHFEVRKGATALDPTTFLNSATASN